MAKTKKKNRQLFQLIALIVVLVLMVSVFFLGKYLNAKAEEEEAAAAAITLYVPYLEDATTITMTAGDSSETYIYNTDSGAWEWAEDSAFPLNSNYLSSMLNTWSVLSYSTQLEITDSLSAYGLEPAACSATISNASGESLTILIGIATGDYYYSMIEGGDCIYLISSSLYNYLNYGLYDMATKETFPSTASETLEIISLQGTVDTVLYQVLTEETVITESEDEDEEAEESTETVSTWFVLAQAEEDQEDAELQDQEITEADYLSELTSEIIGLSFDSMVNYSATAEELAEAGLDSPQYLLTVTYTLTTTDEDENTVTSSESFTLELGNLVDEESYYATINGGNAIYLMDADDVEYIVAVAQSGSEALFAVEETEE